VLLERANGKHRDSGMNRVVIRRGGRWQDSAGLGAIISPLKATFSLVELRGLEPLTPTLPGAGRRSNQARSAANGHVGGVAGRAIVVTVVVKTVVGSRVAARLRSSS
jgi:hypothetical protein